SRGKLISENQWPPERVCATAAAGRAQGTVGVDPDVLVARDHSHDQLLQDLAAVVEERDK
ncbi:hypothetical protein KI387_021938, partial [Taxus chinensis]